MVPIDPLVAFARQDWHGAIAAIEPVLAERERIRGSRAQRDLIELTLLKVYINAGRSSEVQRYLIVGGRTRATFRSPD